MATTSPLARFQFWHSPMASKTFSPLLLLLLLLLLLFLGLFCVSVCLFVRRNCQKLWMICFGIFSQTLLRYVRLIASAVRLSYVCPSSVTVLHPRQRIELFGNIFAPTNSARTWTVCITIWTKIRSVSTGSFQLNTRGYEKLAFSTNISLYFENGKRYSQQFIAWCYFQWPWVTPNLDFKVTLIFHADYLITHKPNVM